MVFTPAPWYHLRPNRAPGALLVLLFDRLLSLANRRCRLIMILDLQHSVPPPFTTNSKIRRLEKFFSSEEVSEVSSERTFPIQILNKDPQKLGFFHETI